MSAVTPTEPGRPPLPGDDVPSAEVLDELLQAFSVDVTRPARGSTQIDLASPEVDELLDAADDAPTPDPTVERRRPESPTSTVEVERSTSTSRSTTEATEAEP